MDNFLFGPRYMYSVCSKMYITRDIGHRCKIFECRLLIASYIPRVYLTHSKKIRVLHKAQNLIYTAKITADVS